MLSLYQMNVTNSQWGRQKHQSVCFVSKTNSWISVEVSIGYVMGDS